MKKYFKVSAFIVFVYISIIMLGFSAQTKLIFHPTKLDKGYKFRSDLHYEEVFLTTPDSVKINGLFFPAQSEKVILYFHGNAGSLDSWQFVYERFQALEYNFFIIDYRGYGKSTGKISEDGLYIDAQTAYDYLIKEGFQENKIIIYGRSLGTGVAVNLASNKNINALILEAPFTSAKKLASEKFPYLFPSLYLKYQFDNISKINNVRAPLLIIHGKQDSTIPFKHGQMVYDRFTGKKLILSINGGHHNDLGEFPEFSQGVLTFITQIEK